jgi:hypothetical protein
MQEYNAFFERRLCYEEGQHLLSLVAVSTMGVKEILLWVMGSLPTTRGRYCDAP